MSRARVERRLKENSEKLKTLRGDLQVTEEQLAQFTDEAEDARLRALVSETPVAEKEHRQADRHRQKMLRHRDAIRDEIARLEQAQDGLLDELTGS